jgi:hypothetical protein
MPHRFIYRRLKRWFIYRVLHVDDTPHRIALGVAVGVFVCWLPCMPVQMILTVALSTLVGANKFVGVPFVWISNPLTIFPVYWPSWRLGKWIVGSGANGFDAFVKAFTLSGDFVQVAQAWWTAIWQIFWPLWVGSLIIAAILAVFTYFTLYRGVVAYRQYRQHRRAHRAEARAKSSPDPNPHG